MQRKSDWLTRLGHCFLTLVTALPRVRDRWRKEMQADWVEYREHLNSRPVVTRLMASVGFLVQVTLAVLQISASATLDGWRDARGSSSSLIWIISRLAGSQGDRWAEEWSAEYRDRRDQSRWRAVLHIWRISLRAPVIAVRAWQQKRSRG